MKNNKLGCLTGTGIFAALITLVTIIGFAFFNGAQMFSAGPLNAQAGEALGGVTSHAQIAECSACHSAPWEAGIMADRCMACHIDVSAELLDSTKLHSIIAQKNSGLACRACHPEHRGAVAALTQFNDFQFPHEAIGYSLNGHKLNVSGQPFVCNDCHQDNTFKFALPTCDTCHRQIDAAFMDKHTLAYGAECLGCHDGVDRYGKNFNHALFFALDGKHANVDCAKCHVNAHSATDLQATPKACSACHQKDDAHKGEFGTTCEACHTSTGWTPAKFDHNLSAFKLAGAHADVACEKCHINQVFKGTPTDCHACHEKDDVHNGQFGTTCETCHTPTGWESTTFDHNLTAFKLDGAHADVACEKCHVNKVFKGTPKDCVACHSDPAFHAGAFGTACTSCHNTTAWSPARFTLDHPQPRTEEGGSGINHGGATCRQCHPATVYQSTCTACHEGGAPSDN